jgi:glycosyltransferase involved in cell wall biosynthesis
LSEEYGIPDERIRVISGGVDTQRFNPAATRMEAREQLGWPPSRPIVLCIRRLVWRMGLHDLIDAVQRLRSQVRDVLVLVGGSGPLADSLQERVRSLGLQEHVKLLGHVPDELLPLAYRAADLSIVPSVALEGFGLVAAESLAAGTPVLVTPVGGLPEVVGELSPNLILPHTGPEALAEGLAAALLGKLRLPSAQSCRVR